MIQGTTDYFSQFGDLDPHAALQIGNPGNLGIITVTASAKEVWAFLVLMLSLQPTCIPMFLNKHLQGQYQLISHYVIACVIAIAVNISCRQCDINVK